MKLVLLTFKITIANLFSEVAEILRLEDVSCFLGEVPSGRLGGSSVGHIFDPPFRPEPETFLCRVGGRAKNAGSLSLGIGPC